MGTEELEYEPVGICFVAESQVRGRRRSVVGKGGKREPRPRRQAWVLRGDAGGSISPEEAFTLTGQTGPDGELELTVDEAGRLPFKLPGLRQALRRSRG